MGKVGEELLKMAEEADEVVNKGLLKRIAFAGRITTRIAKTLTKECYNGLKSDCDGLSDLLCAFAIVGFIGYSGSCIGGSILNEARDVRQIGKTISVPYGSFGELISIDGDNVPEYYIWRAGSRISGGLGGGIEKPTEFQIKYFQKALRQRTTKGGSE